MSTVIISIEGGIGHHFNNTPVFRELKKQGHTVVVLTPFVEVFRHNPNIDEIMHSGENSAYMTELFKRTWKDLLVFNPSVYREFLHMSGTEGLHIKQVVAKQCGLDIGRDYPLEYYPTDSETEKAKDFKARKTDNGRLKLGIIQASGSGIGNNPTADLKELPFKTAEDVIKKTSDRVAWVQVRMGKEKQLKGTVYDMVDYDGPDIRKMFALIAESDFGLGIDSFVQHLMCGVYEKPYVMCLGRGKEENYAHPSCTVVSNPDSCEYFGCEFPFFSLHRLCSRLVCMESITSEQILDPLNKIIGA